MIKGLKIYHCYNTNKMIYFTTIKKLFNIYFTTFPFKLYNYSNRESNFGLLGVSNGLINAQQSFWLANIGTTIIIYNINNTNNTIFFYYNMTMLVWNIFLYINSFNKALNLIKYIK
jgi:hypothetical protein